MPIRGAAGARTVLVRAWDLPTRVFHWSLVLLIAASWATFEYSELIRDSTLVWHKRCGYAALILVVWRLMWGCVGSSTSRFSTFVAGPATTWRYAVSLTSGRSQRYLGHNPLGAFMVLALLTLVGGQAAIGLFIVEHNDVTAGPLYKLASEDVRKLLLRWHRLAFDFVILPAIVLHVAVNVLYSLVKKDPLIPAMLTGLKPRADYADAPEAAIIARPVLSAVLLLGLAAAIVLGGIVALGGRL